MTRGEVVYWSRRRGFGFLRVVGADQLGDVFIHVSDIVSPYRERIDLTLGQMVDFHLAKDPKNPRRFRGVNVLVRE